MSSGSSFPLLLIMPDGDWPALINRTYIRFISYLQDVGFHKEKEVAFSHKQAALMKMGRDGWSAPVL